MPRNQSEKDLPTLKLIDGSKVWEDANGKMHRDNGPAIEGNDGYKAWYIHGKRHREDGPAIEYSNGGKEWWHNGRFIRLEKPDSAT